MKELTFLTIGVCLLCLRGKVECGGNDELWAERDALDAWSRRARLAPPQHAPARDLDCEKPPVYFCEEPPDTVPAEASKVCNYRGERFHEQVFRWVAGRGCLFFTPDFLFVGGANPIDLTTGCYYGELFAPCMEIAKEDGTCGCFPFDPGLQAAARAVRDVLLPAAHGRWERCFRTAADCCSHLMHDDLRAPAHAPAAHDDRQCPTTFDGWTCWLGAEAGSIASEVCSEFAYSGQGPSCHHYSSKECYTNGTWKLQTDYGTCSIAPRLVARYRFHIAVLAVSVAACLPAVLVFCAYRRLRVTRVALHRNLLIAIVMRNVLVIVTRSEIYLDELTSAGGSALARHGAGCRVLAAAERAAAGAVFSCMLVESLYLHRLIAAVFRGPPNVKWLYAIGAVIAWAPVAAWAGAMWARNDHSCWVVYTLPHVQWVLDAPRLLVLAANTALLADILRVLRAKRAHAAAHDATQLSTAKATMFLMPVFGSQFLLTALRPRTTDCSAEQAYYFASYSLEALQGVLVALFYCYINKEVHMLIKATYKKTENAFVSIVRPDSNFPPKSMDSAPDRRMTCSTGLPTASESEPAPKDITTDIETANKTPTLRPKLHVAEIISIQASERLAEILDPVYETVEQNTVAGIEGEGGEGYDALSRSAASTACASDYYGFTNASSVSLDCRDWIRAGSERSPTVDSQTEPQLLESGIIGRADREHVAEPNTGPEYKNISNSSAVQKDYSRQGKVDTEYEDCKMLDEILQYIEGPANNPVGRNSEQLCPYYEEDNIKKTVEDESEI